MREISLAEWEAPMLTPENFPEGRRLYVDGVDVTNRAFAANPSAGWVKAYPVNEHGNIVLKADSPHCRVLLGTVEVK